MSAVIAIVFVVCIAGLLVFILYKDIRERKWKHLVLELLVLLAVYLILNRKFHFLSTIQQQIETKGGAQENVTLVLCFLCTIIGMTAQYFYRQAEADQPKFKFELAPFLMPIFVSPIVFSPLLALLDKNIEGPILTIPKLTLYFVAFQNGFFWKDMLEHQKKRTLKSQVKAQAQAQEA